MTEGRINIIDATPIEAAKSGSGKNKEGEPTLDQEADWHVKKDSRGRAKSIYGYSVHTGVDEDGFIHRQNVTAGNVHDSQERDTLMLGDEAALFADAAYSSEETQTKQKGLELKIRFNEKAIEITICQSRIKNVMHRLALRARVVNGPLQPTSNTMV